jgi:hypothetical protein
VLLVVVHGSILAQLGYNNHHDPDEKEGVANKNEENGDFANIEVYAISFKEGAVLDNILSSAGVVGDDPESDPDRHVEDWPSCTVTMRI